jgi:O-antigen ligase
MSQKLYLRILRVGSWLAFLSVFMISPRLLFPFITSKQIYFNILLEIMAIFWIGLIVKYPEYRPKKSWITFGLLAYFGVVLVSCFTGVDFNLSFWGDIERMLGWFHLVHFLLLYLILITVMRSWEDWRNLLIFSVSAAVIDCFYGMTIVDRYTSIGNTAYVSGYLIFNMFFALILFFREPNKIIKWLYILAVLPMLSAFVRADTSGAAVGVLASIVSIFIVFLILTKNKKVRFAILGSFILFICLFGFLYVNRSSDWMKGTAISNILLDLTAKKATFQTRLISWRAAFKDFHYHPVIGNGHGNYAITFDKYFEPSFYTFTASETYFDRAHNNLIDIATTTGLLGLFAYLSIFVAVGYYLIIAYRRDRIRLVEFSLLVGLFTAYFVQNLAVFDSLVTYMSLMALSGLVYWLGAPEEAKQKLYSKPLDDKEIFTLIIAGVIMLSIVYNYNYKVLKMLIGTIDGQRVSSNLAAATDVYKQALSYDTGLDRDSRTSLIRLYVGNPSALKSMDPQKAADYLDYIIELTKKNVAYNTNDSLNQLLLAQIYNVTADFYSKDKEKFDSYSKLALDAMDKSIAASPGRVTNYYYQAQIYLTLKNEQKAIEALEYAVKLNEAYNESHCHLGRILYFYKQEEKGLAEIGKCIDLGGADKISPVSFVKNLINIFAEKKDYEKVVKLFNQLNVAEPNIADNYVNLAKLYKIMDDKEKAAAAAQKAAQINPNMKAEADKFIQEL